MSNKSAVTETEPIKVVEYTNTCPNCGNTSFTIVEYTYEVPIFGMLLLSVGACSVCGFTRRNVGVLEGGKPRKLILRVSGEKELRYLLVRSSGCAVRIRETALEYTPTMYSYGLITTVEGILHEFHEAAVIVCSRGGSEQCDSILSWLDRAIKGEVEFTLVLCDFEGLSKIVGENVVESDIDEECKNLGGATQH